MAVHCHVNLRCPIPVINSWYYLRRPLCAIRLWRAVHCHINPRVLNLYTSLTGEPERVGQDSSNIQYGAAAVWQQPSSVRPHTQQKEERGCPSTFEACVSLGGEPKAAPVLDPWHSGWVWVTSHGRELVVVQPPARVLVRCVSVFLCWGGGDLAWKAAGGGATTCACACKVCLCVGCGSPCMEGSWWWCSHLRVCLSGVCMCVCLCVGGGG